MHLALYFMADTLQKSFFPTLVENTKIAGNYATYGKGRVQSPKNSIKIEIFAQLFSVVYCCFLFKQFDSIKNFGLSGL